MKISISLHRFLESLIKPDSFGKNARWAFKILERGYITEWELSIAQNMGYMEYTYKDDKKHFTAYTNDQFFKMINGFWD